jgi:hypothetical protein
LTLTNLSWQVPATADNPDRPLPAGCQRLRCPVAEPWLDELPLLIARLPYDDRRALYRDLKCKLDEEQWVWLERWREWNLWAQLVLPGFRQRGQLFAGGRPPHSEPYHNHGFDKVLAGLRELDRQEYEKRWQELNRQKEMQSWRGQKRKLVTKRVLDKPSQDGAALPNRAVGGNKP